MIAFLAKTLLVAVLVGMLVWVRAGRPGSDRLPEGLRGPARAMPVLVGPLLLAVLVWGVFRPRGPR